MGFLLFHVLFIYVVRLFYQNKKYMKRVVLFAMVLMLGVVSVQAQWSVVPEAGMTVMKAGPMVDWKPSWKIGVGVEYQLKPEFLSLKSGLYYT